MAPMSPSLLRTASAASCGLSFLRLLSSSDDDDAPRAAPIAQKLHVSRSAVVVVNSEKVVVSGTCLGWVVSSVVSGGAW
jgi:hypothetical protein